MDCRSGNAAFCDDVRGAFGRTQDGSHADYMLTRDKGVGAVLECSGHAVARRQAAAVASRGATVVYVGVGTQELAIDFLNGMLKLVAG